MSASRRSASIRSIFFAVPRASFLHTVGGTGPSVAAKIDIKIFPSAGAEGGVASGINPGFFVSEILTQVKRRSH